jgi:hypothetical protein
MQKLAILAGVFALLAAAAPSIATTTNATNSAPAPRCRDAQGHFIRCPTPAATTTPARCRNAQGRFIRCPATPATSGGARCRNAQGQFIACPTPAATNTAH